MTVIGLRQDQKIGIAEIDDHHLALLDIAQRLRRAIDGGERQSKIDALLKELIDDTRTHFEYEEALMQAHDFPHLQSHKAEHDELLSRLACLRNALHEGCHPRFEEGMDASDDWTLTHVRERDIPLGAFLRARGLS